MNPVARIVLLGLIFVTRLLPAVDGSLLGGETHRMGPAPFELIPQVSLVLPTNFVVTTGDRAVSYSDGLTGLPLFSLGAAFPLTWVAGLELQGLFQIGYASKTELMSVRDLISGTEARDRVHLVWMPLSAGVSTSFEVAKFRFAKPTLSVGGGAQWVRQTANLSGVDGSYLSPFVYFSPGFTFSAGERGGWFGGFTFGTTFRHSFGKQRVNAWSYDLGLNIWL